MVIDDEDVMKMMFVLVDDGELVGDGKTITVLMSTESNLCLSIAGKYYVSSNVLETDGFVFSWLQVQNQTE